MCDHIRTNAIGTHVGDKNNYMNEEESRLAKDTMRQVIANGSQQKQI